ncbi:AI-2E family transporter [Tardiphaga sp. vice304]|uniref:AI-2E family transporter n=1 Tax=unclassified Tardiphaga TaxID=2631404 RepID=UPI00116469E9|nr:MULTISPECIES: AI-2E family transporter [unclassified Tardiphaga]QDM19108.1 AI-2E family transporter [Tardiphaga sp. vice278]QDM24088.1 AI-2E family transporter [Tardiphaga sp. vice154]QDM29312.1 AI-2E family transporter [Tardiphaga sp. vice304]
MAARVATSTAREKSSEKVGDEFASTVKKPLPLGARARMNARIVLALAIFGLALWTAASFLPALIWATILAVSLWPLYLKFAAPFSSGRRSNLAAFIFTAIVALVLFTPMSLAVYQIAQQSDVLSTWLKRAQESGVEVPDWVSRLPVVAESLQSWWRANLSDPKAATAWLQSVNADHASELFKTFGGQLLHRLFLFLFSLLTLFFLLRNGRDIASRFLETCDRLIGNAGEGLVGKMVDATRGTVNGTVLVAVGEGLLIGFGYFVAGVPNPVLFTVLTTAFAMLPFGAWIAFITAAVVLISGGGSGLAAGAVFCWGAIIMLAGDHFVWPTLVGGSTRLPFVLAFVGIFGGLATFGLFGLFLGPVVMAALLTVWREWIFRPTAQ